MTDEEIGLAKAMLSKGMANDHIHFYFNKADRLISSGRIAQIKTGKYGSAVAEATSAELEAFLRAWQERQALGAPKGPLAPIDPQLLGAMFLPGPAGWQMRLGETDHVECKLSFCVTPDYRFADVIKSIAGLANHKGGHIFFGVRNATFLVEGLANAAFAEADPALINRVLAGALDPVPRVIKTMVEIGGTSLGVLYVEKHDHAPVIALKNIAGDVREGAIYFRYVGETRAIKPGELRQIIANREQRAIAEFSRRMARVAAGSVATVDLDSGEVDGNTGRFLIGKDLLRTIQFIREGDFAEVKGAPALRLIGEVEPVSEVERERVRIIRDSVTPDAVTRNFLNGERVAEPMQYLHAQAHAQRRWQPIWFYVGLTDLPLETIVRDLRSLVATHPASRDAVVDRLVQRVSAYKLHPGKPAVRLREIAAGKLEAPTTVVQDMEFALAIQGLQVGQGGAEAVKPLLLASLNRAQGQDARSSQRRSAIYRAACRLDEVLYGPAASAQ